MREPSTRDQGRKTSHIGALARLSAAGVINSDWTSEWRRYGTGTGRLREETEKGGAGLAQVNGWEAEEFSDSQKVSRVH